MVRVLEEAKREGELKMKKFGLRLLAVTTLVIAVGAVFAGTSMASGGPFMPCCFNFGTGGAAAHDMACCVYNAAMQCCNRFF